MARQFSITEIWRFFVTIFSEMLLRRSARYSYCIENGLSIVENPEPHGKSYNKWLGDQAKPSHRELLRVAIDNALSQSPADFEELLKLLQEGGWEVSKRGKSYRLKLPDWDKAARMDSLGEGYRLEDLQAAFSGKKEHIPKKKNIVQTETQKVNLLVDIQAKLQAGKGAGYTRWAKVFNLKQMAQTMNYLSENNLLEYALLEEKAAAATAHHNDLSAQIKVAEKRMAEIAVLRTHIVNYAKTREVYVAYARRVTLRNSGKNMRKKFCSTRLLRMPLMRWASRSCQRSKSYRQSTQNCWKKRKRLIPSIGAPVKKCGSF